MTTEIALRAETAFLELASNSPVAILIAGAQSESDLTPEQFAIVERVASAPPPALPVATDEDIRKIIGTMAGTLKAPRTSIDEGRLKLSVYKRMLGQIPLGALKFATERAIATLEWMPVPAELLKLAEEFTAPERQLHARARVLVERRKQREFEELLIRIRDGELSQSEIDALPDQIKRVAETRAFLRFLGDGRYVHRPQKMQEFQEDESGEGA